MKEHQKCLAIVAKAEADGEQLRDWIRRYRRETSETLQQLRNENGEVWEASRQLLLARDSALSKVREQETLIADLKQQLTATLDDSTAYKSIQPMLVSLQDKMQSTVSEIGTTIDTFTKKNLCTELPGPGSYNWTASNPNYSMLDPGLFANNYNMPLGNTVFNPQQQQQPPPVQPVLYGQAG